MPNQAFSADSTSAAFSADSTSAAPWVTRVLLMTWEDRAESGGLTVVVPPLPQGYRSKVVASRLGRFGHA